MSLPPQRFADRVSLITGAATGIGAATATAFAKEGAAVVIGDVNVDAASRLAEAIVADGGRAISVMMDVRDEQQCRRAVEQAVEAFGGLDIVFCNAGVFEPGTVESQTLSSWEQQIDVMLRGTFLTCKFAVPELRRRGGGAVVLSGSNCSHVGCPGRFAYTAAKAAMPVLVKQLSNDYFHSAGIRFNCISPGYVQTPMTEAIWRRQTGSEGDAELPEAMVARWQKPADIAACVLFLASPAAADITGVTLPVSRTALLRVALQRTGA